MAVGKTTINFTDEAENRIRMYLIEKVGPKYTGYLAPFVEVCVLSCLERFKQDPEFEKRILEEAEKQKHEREAKRGPRRP